MGAWEPSEAERDPVAILMGQNDIRDPALAALRNGRMAASPWTFYRGAAAVMAADLAASPHTGLQVQLCGDAHILNFGLWATPERNLAFDLRDFDETLPGPFEWDVMRLAASIVVLARTSGLDGETADDAVRRAVRIYCKWMAEYAGAGQLDIWYDTIPVEQMLGHFDPGWRRDAVATIHRKGRHRTSRGAFDKLTTTVDGETRIIENPPKLTHFDAPDREGIVAEVFGRYAATLQDDRRHCLEQFRVIDVARQVVGVGSVGMRVHLMLLDGRSGDDPLFLQVKQAGASVYEPYLGPSAYDNHGARVVNGQRLLQSATDIFVGWTRYEDTDFYVRQFRDMKIIADGDEVAPLLGEFATACGEVLAKAHARTGDPVAIAAYLGKGRAFANGMAGFAHRYAEQTERDHQRLVAAIASGKLEAEQG